MQARAILIKVLLLALTNCLATGCVSTVIEGGHVARSKLVIAHHIDAARAGDAESQFKVGDAYCCSVNERSALLDTKTSVAWLCSAARQSYVPAMLKLGKIYSGDVVDGVRLPRRALQGVLGKSTDLAVASAWLKLAGERGDREAEKLIGIMNDTERSRSEVFYQQGLEAPCEWDEVFADA